MKSAFEKIYLKLPILIQNIVLSLYGLLINRIQRGKRHDEFLKKLSKRFLLSELEFQEYQVEKLKQVVEESVKYVPYYHQLFKKHKVAVSDIQKFDDLNKIPLLNKHQLRRNSHLFVNSLYNSHKLNCISTTGTTGTPLRTYFNSDARQLNYAFYDRFLHSVSLNSKGKRATFGGRVIVSPEQKKPPFWRFSTFQKNLLLSSYHLTNENIPSYIEQLSMFKPNLIDTYPSSIYTLANYMNENRINGRSITKGIVTSAECLFQWQREIIESVFGVPIFDQYGSSEMCVFAAQCLKGRYHIHMDYGIVEFLNKDGSNAKPGEEAELVCTGFVNPVMPLIRYRIGDRGVFSDEDCECGSPFPVMEKIIGRMDDVIVTPDGRKISRFGSVLYGLPVKEVQYIQKNKVLITVLIVKAKNYNQDTEEKIKKELTKRLGNQIVYEFKYLDEIPRGPGGKLKTVISHVC